jgi:hypothetical protein
MSSSKPQAEFLGRLFGILVFLVGIGLLGIVFSTAWTLFKTPIALPPTAAGIGSVLTNLLRQVLFLILMTVLASIIASRGLTLYYAANPWTDAHHPGATAAVPIRNGKADADPHPASTKVQRRTSEPSEA